MKRNRKCRKGSKSMKIAGTWDVAGKLSKQGSVRNLTCWLAGQKSEVQLGLLNGLLSESRATC